MTANEVDAVMKVTTDKGFQVHCLYNQETDEHPQLYFSHQLNVGDPEKLAHVVRQALEKTDTEFS
jgi:uncharacterized protein DUF1259